MEKLMLLEEDGEVERILGSLGMRWKLLTRARDLR